MITIVENMSDDFDGTADEQGPAVDEEAEEDDDDDDDAIDDVHALIFVFQSGYLLIIEFA